jgi:hypothetical protein
MSDEHAVDGLRKLEPFVLRVTCLDGHVESVAVPKIRNRWQRVIKVIDSMAWTRIDALDKAGAVLGSVEDEEAAGFEVDDQDGAGERDERDMRIAKVLLEVMRTTQKETRQMFEVQMRGQAELVESLIGGVRSIQQTYEANMAVSRARDVAEAGAAAGGNPEIMAMMQMAMAAMSQPKLPAPAPAPRKVEVKS